MGGRARNRAAWAILAPVMLFSLTERQAAAMVDLDWSPSMQVRHVGDVVEIGLIARSDELQDQTISALDVVFTWDPAALAFIEAVDNGPFDWLLSGFFPDDQLDGLNDSFSDGDAKYTALASLANPAIATPDGLMVTTLRFATLSAFEQTVVVIEGSLGTFSITRVFGTDFPNQDVTGTLGEAEVSIQAVPALWVTDLALLPEAESAVWVSGRVDGDATFGVTILAEIVPRGDTRGTVTFTESPPVDIEQVGDPWPGAGAFTPFDTDTAGALTLNGSVDDNATFLPTPLVFVGPLTSCPIIASSDARGEWDVRLSTSVGDSAWEGLATVTTSAVIRVLAPGDANGDDMIDLFDFSRLAQCFTGDVGPVQPAAYDSNPALSCGAFDLDGDGDVDATDHGAFGALLGGP